MRVPGGACSKEIEGLASSPIVVFFDDVLATPMAALLRVFCATGSVDAAGKAAAKKLATQLAVLTGILPVAAVVCVFIPGGQPFAALFGGAVAVTGPLAAVFDAMGKGAPPRLADVARATSAGAGLVRGNVSEAGLTAAAAALSQAAEDAGVQPVSFPETLPVSGNIGRADALKLALKRAKAKARAIEAAKLKIIARRERAKGTAAAKSKSADKSAACKARGGVFDPTAPDGCRVGGGASKAGGFIGGLVDSFKRMPAPAKVAVVVGAFKVAKAVRG